MEEQAARIKENKLVHAEWRDESKDWREILGGMLAGVRKQISLGPNKEVLTSFDALDAMMMDETASPSQDKDALDTLEKCFPLTSRTGERKDKEVNNISHLKYTRLFGSRVSNGPSIPGAI